MCGKWAINFGISFFWLELKLNFFRLICSSCFFISHTGLTAQFHGSVLRPDLTQNSAKRVLKSNTPRKQFCLQCTFPRLVFARRFARARGRIIMKFPTRAPRLKLLSRSFGSKQKYFSVRRNIFEFHFRSQKCEQKCEHIWLQNWAVELQG
mgnify:CR=1 FL=1